jgi:uncharacterized RDD family membrane protein YckC
LTLDNTVEVETPEHVRFRFHIAGPTRRALAYLIDTVVRAILLVLLEIVLVLGTRTGSHLDSGHSLTGGGTLLALFALEWGYFVLCESLWNGTTPGKRALRLRVVKVGGTPLSFMDSVLRNLLRAADFLPVAYLLGLLVMSWDSRFARLGDRAAGTMVVIEDPVRVAPAIALVPPATEDEMARFPARISLTPTESESLELLLRRRDLSAARRSELADMLAPALARRLGVPAHDPVRFLALVYHLTVGRARAGKAGT